MNTFKFFYLLLAAGFVMWFSGCTQNNLVQEESSKDDVLGKLSVSSEIENSSCKILYAGQDIDAGTVCVSVEGENLKVTYQTKDGWELTEAHLWLGENLSEMPQTRKGNPKIGNFPFNSGDIIGETSFSFYVPIADLGGEPYLCDKTIFVAAHAALRKDNGDGSYQTETGWADGDKFVDRGSWATFFSFTFVCTDDPPEEKECETAFALGESGVCFIESPWLDANRWGWTNGPLSAGSYSMEIYAGAGQCDTDKGTLVGQLQIEYNGDSATVTYNMFEGFTMDETHLYIGNEPYARDKNGEFTVAPGQYGNIHDLQDASSDTFTIGGLSGDIYVVAHAVACGEFTE